MPNPKILFISATAIMGGAEVYVTTLARQLQRDGYRPVIICPHEGDFTRWLRERDIPVLIRPIAPQIVGSARASFKINLKSLAKIGLGYLKAVRTIYRVVRQEKADLVHINSMKAGLYAAPASWLARKPVVWDFKDLVIDEFYSPRLRRIVLLWLRLFVKKVIANSQAIRDELVRRGIPGGKIEALPNGLDLTRFKVELKSQQTALAERLGLPREAELVTIIGRLAPWKGHKVFLEAAALVKQARPRAQFLVVGDIGFDPPSYRDSLVDLARQLGLADDTHWLGFRADQAELIAASDVIVHSSILPEPLGLTPIEAQALATPVVAAAAGGCLETIEDGVTGLLYPMGDAKALAGAVIRLLEDPALRATMGQAGRKRVERLFDLRDNARKVEAIYSELLGSKRR
jgi:glycosyltransferase involved in cell wall biosynthesis